MAGGDVDSKRPNKSGRCYNAIKKPLNSAVQGLFVVDIERL